ncbi:MAG: ArnT family glycosyltransferase [Myxococcota bacterium]
MSRSPGRAWTVAVLAGLVALIALARLHTYHEPLDRDIAFYRVIAHEMSAGRPLYSDLWCHQPPGAFLTWAAAEHLAGYGPGAVYLLGVASAVLSLFGVYFAGAAFRGGSAGGLWAAGLWAVVSGDLGLEANQPNLESFLNTCCIWSLVLLARSDPRLPKARLAAIGLLFAAIVFYKHVVIIIPIFLALAHVAYPTTGSNRSRALREAAVMIAIIFVPWAVLFGYLAASGRFEVGFASLVTYNLSYSGMRAGGVLPNVLASFSPDKLLPSYFHFSLPLSIVALVGAVSGLARGPRRPWVLLLGYAAGAHLAIGFTGMFFPHYYQLRLPWLVIGAGWVLAELGRAGGRRMAVGIHGLGLILLVPLVAHVAPAYRLDPEAWSREKYGGIFVEVRDLSERVDALLAPAEIFFVWGNEPGFNLYTQRPPPAGTLFVSFYLRGPLREPLTRQTLNQIERSPPELWIVMKAAQNPSTMNHPVYAWFADRYEPLDGVPASDSFLLYRLRGGRLAQRMEHP